MPAGGTYQLAAPVGVEYHTGPMEYIRAGVSIPGGVVDCLTTGLAEGLLIVGKTARCVTGVVFPIPEPTQRLIYAQPVATQAAPCAPVYVAPPRATPRPAPCAPPPVPIAFAAMGEG